MPRTPRNAPCPCGSGRKYKKCCGLDRETERAIKDRISAREGVVRLAYRSPRLIPVGTSYDRWLERVPAGGLEIHPEEAFEILVSEERLRIVATCAELFPGELSELTRLLGEEDMTEALLTGAMAAGIRDDRRRVVKEFVLDLELIEESSRLAGEPFEGLAMVLDGVRLWDVADGHEAEREIDSIPEWLDDDAYEIRWQKALRTTSARLATDWHRRRLSRLVGQVEAQLPLAGFPRASAAIRSGCESFATDEEFRARLAAILLSDLFGREQFAALRALLAA